MNSKPMSAADYRKNADRVKAERPTEIVTLQSGSVFELRRPDLRAWVMTGRVPQSLLEEGMKAWKAQGKIPNAIQSASPQVVTDGAVFALTVVQECTVKPRLVEFPDPSKDEIGPQTMLEEDFQEIFNWAMTNQGVTGLDGLKSFRPRRTRRTAGGRSNSKKHRNKSEQIAEPASVVS